MCIAGRTAGLGDVHHRIRVGVGRHHLNVHVDGVLDVVLAVAQRVPRHHVKAEVRADQAADKSLMHQMLTAAHMSYTQGCMSWQTSP